RVDRADVFPGKRGAGSSEKFPLAGPFGSPMASGGTARSPNRAKIVALEPMGKKAVFFREHRGWDPEQTA
ncbi:MAG: hypothetical protein WCJ21_00440, partial [Planctomycetota bacterium]